MDGPGGGLPNTGYAIAVRGSEVFAGHQSGISRWNGQHWLSVGPGLNGPVTDIAIFKGDVYASGQFTQSGNDPVTGIGRWDGSRWLPLASGLDGPVHSLGVTREALYVAGPFTTAGGVPAHNIARWDGNTWSALPFGSGPWIISALSVAEDNIYVCVGDGQILTQHKILRWDGNGWARVKDSLNGPAMALAIREPDIYVMGAISAAGPYPSLGFAHWRSTSGPLRPLVSAPVEVASGSELTYEVLIQNTTGRSIAGAKLRVQLPEGTEFLSASDGGSALEGIVTWSLPEISPDQ